VSGLEVAVDRGACMGAGECVYRAPKTFGFDEEGRAIVIGSGADPDDDVIMAANCCPNFAIKVTRDGAPV
jgi:ferredoxin